MTDHKAGKIDDLLREALADDLPPDVAAGMRQRIERFRSEKMTGEAKPSTVAWAWLFRRGVWAALSILMLVAGILLQAGRSSNPLTDRISTVKAAYTGLEAPRR
ncbi:MAG: hypothetical protein FJY82_14400 [Candidatus Aminicenantes bacterium]|nr:hypothetical protein [Candidatus Aminicenantes bacterium]